jgi:hypothetical protein
VSSNKLLVTVISRQVGMAKVKLVCGVTCSCSWPHPLLAEAATSECQKDRWTSKDKESADD